MDSNVLAIFCAVLGLVTQSTCLFVTPWTVAPQAPLCMGIFQARTLEWVPMLFSRGSFQPRDRTQVSHIAGRFLTIWATREALLTSVRYQKNHNTLTRKIWRYNNYNLIFFFLTKETCIKELISRVIIVVTNRQQVLGPDSVAKWFMPTGFCKTVLGLLEQPSKEVPGIIPLHLGHHNCTTLPETTWNFSLLPFLFFHLLRGLFFLKFLFLFPLVLLRYNWDITLN